MGEKKGFFKRLVEGLTKTRNNIVSGIDSIFSGFSAIDEDFYEEIEEILIMGDLGINATTAIIEDLKQKVKEQHIKEPSACKQLLIDSIKAQMNVGETAYEFENRAVLYRILYDLEELITIKKRFIETLTPDEIKRFWNTSQNCCQ